VPDHLKLKIYGERNTGTNYLAELVQRNMDVDVLPGLVPWFDVPAMMTRKLRRLLPQAADQIHERARDRYFKATFERHLGWKHMCPAPDMMSEAVLRDVRFLMVLKNPYAWLLSLHSKPYHVGGMDERFEDFLDRFLPVMETRENIGSEPLPAVEVWNRKVRGYFALEAAARHAVMVRYEGFLADEEATLTRVADDLDIPRRSHFLSVPRGVKRGDRDRTQIDFAAYYLEERWRDKLSADAIRRINSLLDGELVVRLGYQLIDPDLHAATARRGDGDLHPLGNAFRKR
jgi:hypothetical protein